MKIHWLLFSFLLCACATNTPPPTTAMPNEKEFEVPTALADKFAVKEEAAVPVAEVAAPVATTPVASKNKKEKPPAPPSAKEKKLWASRWSIEPFFRTGERYVFDVTYFGATAGELVMMLLSPKTVAERPVFHIRAEARTASVFSLFYRMNDVAESFMDSTALVSHKFSLKLDESMQQRDVLELYDQRKNTVHYWSKLDHKKKGKAQEQKEISIKPFAQDGLSAFFFLRTLPLEIGKVFEFPVVTNGKLRDVRVTVVRRENLQTKIGEIPAIVVKPDVVLDGVLKTYGDSYVWISDDNRRIILKVDAKIKIGSVIAYLREYDDGSGSAGKR